MEIYALDVKVQSGLSFGPRAGIGQNIRFSNKAPCVTNELASPRSYLYLATFVSIQQTSFEPKSGWGMVVYAPQWLLANQF